MTRRLRERGRTQKKRFDDETDGHALRQPVLLKADESHAPMRIVTVQHLHGADLQAVKAQRRSDGALR